MWSVLFPEESVRFLYLGFLKTLNNSRFVFLLRFRTNFSKKELPFDSFFQPIKMAKKKTTTTGLQNDDDESGAMKETTR